MKPAMPNTESGGRGDFDVYKACESMSKWLSISPAKSLAGESCGDLDFLWVPCACQPHLAKS